MKKLIVVFLLLTLSNSFCNSSTTTIISMFNRNDSFTQIALGIFECLHKQVKIHLKSTSKNNEIYEKHIANALRQGNRPHQPNICIYSSAIQLFRPAYFKELSGDFIKYAYSTFESTQLPQSWVNLLNQNFDGVIVPDEAIKIIYEKSGIKKPIFVLPCVCKLEKFLMRPIQSKPHKPFTFGCSGSFIERKNFVKLLNSFIDEFGNNSKVQLILHSRTSWGVCKIKDTLLKTIKDRKITNVKIIDKSFNEDEYQNLFSSFDAYAFISKGEGFSYTPREALALGIPCILSNNTAHKTICDAGVTIAIPADIIVPGKYDQIQNKIFGDFFDCKKEDVQAALRYVFENYSELNNQREQGREWVRRYTKENLHNIYLNLVNPKRILLGNRNEIGNDYFMTNDKKLYKKYTTLISNYKAAS